METFQNFRLSIFSEYLFPFSTHTLSPLSPPYPSLLLPPPPTPSIQRLYSCSSWSVGLYPLSSTSSLAPQCSSPNPSYLTRTSVSYTSFPHIFLLLSFLFSFPFLLFLSLSLHFSFYVFISLSLSFHLLYFLYSIDHLFQFLFLPPFPSLSLLP